MKCSTKLLSWVFVATLGSAAVAQAGVIADFQADFTGNSNGHSDGTGTGVWTYYGSNNVDPYDVGASLTLLGWDAANSQYGNNTFDIPQVRSTNVHPGQDGNAQENVLVRWTNNGPSGTFDLNGFFQRNNSSDIGDGVDVYVYGAELLLLSNGINATTGNPSVAFSYSVFLATGESIDLLVNPRAANSVDRTDLSATISSVVPTPMAFGGGIALMGMIFARRRR